jgi:hypothetical protein
MTGRDRIVLIAIGVVVVLGAAWMLVVSPERHKAAGLASTVASAQSRLSSAESELQNAQAAQKQYASAYAAIVNLGKAVPASQEVPSLIFQLEQASNGKQVEFASISAGASSGAASGASSGAAAAAAALSATPAGFTQMPFTFVFNGSYFELEHLFEQLNRFTVRTAGTLQVGGRLLTIQGVKLAPLTQSAGAVAKGAPTLTGTITATAYVLPATQGLTSGATPASPAGAGPTTASSGASSSPTTPAVVKVTP